MAVDALPLQQQLKLMFLLVESEVFYLISVKGISDFIIHVYKNCYAQVTETPTTLLGWVPLHCSP